MTNWWEMTDDEIEGSSEALTVRAHDYHDALLSSDSRRAVFMDILRSAGYYSPDFDSAPERALVVDIKRKCGINDPLVVLEAEAYVSARYSPKVQEPKAVSLEPEL